MNQCRINWTGDAGSRRNLVLFLFSITPYQATRPPSDYPFRNLPTRQSFSDHGIVWIYCLLRETSTFTTQVKACRNARQSPDELYFRYFYIFYMRRKTRKNFFDGLEGDNLLHWKKENFNSSAITEILTMGNYRFAARKLRKCASE